MEDAACRMGPRRRLKEFKEQSEQTLCDSSFDQGSSMSSEVMTWALKIPSSGKGRFKGKDHRLQ